MSDPTDYCESVVDWLATDQFLRAAPRRLDRALGIEHDIKVCPDAGYAFLSRSGDELGVVAGTLGCSRPEFRDGWSELTDLGPCFWRRRRLAMTMVESLGGGSLVWKGAVR